ncbi:MAG TPA: homocysteine S-methyltransferase [Acidobacteriaceae bacterium]|jgi:homocysteine S-methyltransferase|nr:homocysteine S-methyltransferase [Acidobacteriaceae bacterium]
MTPRTSIDFSAIRVLDGGLATELEHRGCDIAGPLWSAHVLDRSPAQLTAVHLDFLRAGADCIATAGYQISAMGYRDLGLTAQEAPAAAHGALLQSVSVAEAARTEYARENPRRVWIAASLGPYGAALHNGAEYHGRLEIDDDALLAFHTERLKVLAETSADLIAFETVPSLTEARVIVQALRQFPQLAAWISFTCRDSIHVAHGEPLQLCAEMLSGVPRVVAIGINCVAPHLILPLLAEAQQGARGRKPVIVYPNSGEVWNPATRTWHGEDNTLRFGTMARSWFAAGAQAVGGCCRTRPTHIAAVARAAAAVLPGSPAVVS